MEGLSGPGRRDSVPVATAQVNGCSHVLWTVSALRLNFCKLEKSSSLIRVPFGPPRARSHITPTSLDSRSQNAKEDIGMFTCRYWTDRLRSPSTLPQAQTIPKLQDLCRQRLTNRHYSRNTCLWMIEGVMLRSPPCRIPACRTRQDRRGVRTSAFRIDTEFLWLCRRMCW